MSPHKHLLARLLLCIFPLESNCSAIHVMSMYFATLMKYSIFYHYSPTAHYTSDDGDDCYHYSPTAHYTSDDGDDCYRYSPTAHYTSDDGDDCYRTKCNCSSCHHQQHWKKGIKGQFIKLLH